MTTEPDSRSDRPAPPDEPPFLIADVSAWQPHPDFALLTGPWVGAILKATQGLHYAPAWFREHWPRAASLRIRGAYHYLVTTLDGAAQADYYLAAMDRAGGWRDGDIRPVVDVERGGANAAASAAQMIDATSAFAARVLMHTGRRPILYGRGAMRDLGIVSQMGCDGVWNPGYTAEMPMRGLEAWTLEDVLLWQYASAGEGDASRHQLPLVSPIGGDCSVYVDGTRKPTWESLRRRMCG